MQELIDTLEQKTKADYLLDTCFLMHILETDRLKHLEDFCRSNSVGMSSFNLKELSNRHHILHGTLSHHLRNFLKQKMVCNIPLDFGPGEREKEREYVSGFDPKLLEVVRDPSDAVLLVLGLKIRANILTRDKHHIFTTKAENYLSTHGIKVMNELPRNVPS